jgi:hypothetical protein
MPRNPLTRKTEGGHPYAVHRLSPEAERSVRRWERALSRMERRLAKWLAAAAPHSALPLFSADVKLLGDALQELHLTRHAREALDDLRCRDRALYQLYRGTGANGPREVVKALGWSTGKRGPRRAPEVIVARYVELLGQSPYRDLRPIDPPPPEPLSEVEALYALAREYRQTATALRTSLIRARSAIRAKNRASGASGPGSLVDDFRVPSEATVLRHGSR